MIKCKICGISNLKTLNYIVNHPYPPKFIGFICNYPKSIRHINYKKLATLLKVKKKNTKFVAVLVNPKINILEKIKKLNFDYYQLYDVTPEKTKYIKKNYKKKIISAITIKKSKDVMLYKKYLNMSEIILFDGKGYEKSVEFNHSLIKNLPKNFTKMIAGNIKYNDNLEKYKKITDIIDISGSLETNKKKNNLKIDYFLKNIKKTNVKN